MGLGKAGAGGNLATEHMRQRLTRLLATLLAADGIGHEFHMGASIADPTGLRDGVIRAKTADRGRD